MKNITLLSLVVASLLFTACGEKTKEVAMEATNKVTEAVKEDTASAVEATKKAASEATEASKAKVAEVAMVSKMQADEAAQALKDRVVAATAVASATASTTESVKSTATSVVVDNAAGKAAYAKCAGCHGADGKTKALGKSAVIAGDGAVDLETKIAAYKAGTRNVAGMGMLMKGQVTSMDEVAIKAVAAYISSL